MFKKLATNFKSKHSEDLIIVTILIILNILPRLAYILNGGFFLDGDEAILGTAIRYSLSSHQLVAFLYGQNYGFIPFEVLMGSITGFFFGVNIFSLKIAMLVFWLANIVLLYYIGKKILNSRRWTFVVILLISFIPVWFDWATKARIGYQVSLLLSNVIILLSLSKRDLMKIFAVSLLLVLMVYIQPLWLIIVAPFVAYYFFSNLKFKDVAILASSSLAFLASSYFLLLAFGFKFQLQDRLSFSQISVNIKNIFTYYSIAYSGRFFDAYGGNMNNLEASISYIFIGLLIIAIIYDIYLALRKKLEKNDILFLSAVISFILFMLFYNGNTMEYHYRYLLPVFIPAMFLIVLAAKKLKQNKVKIYIYVFLIIFALISLVSSIFSYVYLYPPINDGQTEVERIETLKDFLETNDIKCVYSLDWMISQHINYFIPDVLVRHQEIDPRRPWDSNKVDLMAAQSGNCALVGLWYQMPSFTYLYELNDIFVINKRYLVYLRPQREDLLNLGFKLTN